ncbi:hypothetical protein WICPIJ_002346 [Wickerhamomyces pijperi]|uniref:DUF221-domain-containing protein n=1 Tax=Wickerhamomyces pijperi TaxID=599730 RepID=A0A9P8Q977_WICPI|nr:hypothetical protein WICPIJ_002346 [Wickerhamomyces pijperi]
MSALPPDIDPTKQPLRVFKAQLIVSIVLGVSAFMVFCYLRYRWPHIYAVRTLRKKDLKSLPNSYFGWLAALYRVTDEQILEHSGLDAYVFLGFFRMAIKLFALFSAISICFIGPIRYYYTGYFDSDGISWTGDYGWHIMKVVVGGSALSLDDGGPPDFSPPADLNRYKAAWMYTVFTYVFTGLAYYLLWQQTEKVVQKRQKYLGQQNSVTDRTILLEGLPEEFNPNEYIHNGASDDSAGTSTDPSHSLVPVKSTVFDEEKLKTYIEELGIGKVSRIEFASDWSHLQESFSRRKEIIRNLEVYYSKYIDLKVEVYTYGNLDPSVSPLKQLNYHSPDEDESSRSTRPTLKLGFLGLFGERVDAIDHYSEELARVDSEIREARKRNNFVKATSAFVTMDSVASAQMAAQTVLDPHVHRLIARLAPAPHDVRWDNLAISKTTRFIRSNIISLIIGLSTVGLIFPVIYLSTFLNLKTIEKFWPALAELIKDSEFLTLLMGLIPPYLYTLLNISVPYFYAYLSKHQGFISNGEVELSTLSKNFFYIFFNLFLVFTLAGAATNVWALLGDTTKIAYELANSLKNLSLFYVDLILLQGLGMFPFRLLQVGTVFIEIVSKLFYCRTARDYRKLYYTPPVFDFGLQLPQHILILIITLIYSVTSTKIVTAGLVYFLLGFYTYKYQLLYTMVHPQHSTGQCWPMIVRRMLLGLILFQITMAGTLALEHAFILSILILPLMLITIIVAYNFEKDYLPLSFFIALKAIKSGGNKVFQQNQQLSPSRPLSATSTESTPLIANGMLQMNSTNSLTSNTANISPKLGAHNYHSLKKRRSTIDESREENISYECPYLTDPLDGPIIGFDGDYIQQVQYQTTVLAERVVRRYHNVHEWE